MDGINIVPSGAPSRSETVRDLLIRLAANSLILFRSVCPVWSVLLRSPSFILDHFNYHSNKNPLLIIQRFHCDQRSYGLEFFWFDIRSRKIQEFHVLRVTNSDRGYKIVDSCNGLICVCNYSHDPSSCLFLWNPATRKIKRILEHPNALLPHKVSPYCLLGFAYNASVNDYEVVRIYSSESSNVGIHAIHIERYSLNSGLWNEVEFSNHRGAKVNGPFLWIENAVTVKRKMFWVARTATNQRFSQEFIVSFDSENNMLGKVSLPNFANFEVSKKLTEYRESLGVLYFSESAVTMDRFIELWVYDDKVNGFDRWNKTKTIKLSSNMDIRPVSIWKDEVFIASGNEIRSLRSDLRALFPSAREVGDCCYVSSNYAESLVAVNNGGNGNQINEEDDENSNNGKTYHLSGFSRS